MRTSVQPQMPRKLHQDLWMVKPPRSYFRMKTPMFSFCKHMFTSGTPRTVPGDSAKRLLRYRSQYERLLKKLLPRAIRENVRDKYRPAEAHYYKKAAAASAYQFTGEESPRLRLCNTLT